ncbi:MAG TPA: 3-oxoacyl-ACP reductase family protein [Thermoplasmata archaeon]
MLQGKVTLVTGASRGIGRAIALMAAKNGATVVANYNRSEHEAKELLDQATADGLKIDIFKADVSSEQELDLMFKHVREKYGRLDVLVNNAGIVSNNLLMMTKTDELNRIIEVNCKGPFLCMRYAAKLMMKQKSGKIVNISSIVGVQGNSGQVAYSGSKSFIIGMTKSAAKELGMYGISVNAVAPGLIDTDMTKNLAADVKLKLLSNTPLGRIGTPEDVAKVVVFLCSDMGGFVSGQVIGVDGAEIM